MHLNEHSEKIVASQKAYAFTIGDDVTVGHNDEIMDVLLFFFYLYRFTSLLT